MAGHTFSMSDVRYILLATLVIFVLEAVAGGLRGARWRDFGVTALCFATNSAITRPLAGLAIASLAALALPHYAGACAEAPLWLTFAVTLLAMEFAFYWMHRWAHEGQRAGSRLSGLWKLHRTHHSATHLNVSITMRQNIFWAFVVPNSWIIGASIYLGAGEGAALALIVIYSWNLLTHTNWRWDAPLMRSKTFAPALRAF
ncbi:MAG: sterol desaturase family protein, partial [Hyphomonadaceae bacterium]